MSGNTYRASKYCQNDKTVWHFNGEVEERHFVNDTWVLYEASTKDANVQTVFSFLGEQTILVYAGKYIELQGYDSALSVQGNHTTYFFAKEKRVYGGSLTTTVVKTETQTYHKDVTYRYEGNYSVKTTRVIRHNYKPSKSHNYGINYAHAPVMAAIFGGAGRINFSLFNTAIEPLFVSMPSLFVTSTMICRFSTIAIERSKKGLVFSNVVSDIKSAVVSVFNCVDLEVESRGTVIAV